MKTILLTVFLLSYPALFAQESKSKNKKVLLDTLNIANERKMYSYLTIPQYDVFTKDSNTINLPEYLLTHRSDKDKPTLLVTWSYKWCPPCIKKIDSLLNFGTALNYNIVLINRDDEETRIKYPSAFISFSDLKAGLASHSPNYNEDALLLFDRNNQLFDIDNGATPLWVWLDKKLNILGAYSGFTISVADIRNVLSNIDQGKITNGVYKYYNNDIPCEQVNASTKMKVTTLSDGNTVTLEVYDADKDSPYLEIEYLMSKKGKLFYKALQAK
ncbi:MAG: redoxin domain-containing protein [Chitinophagaceae bacterium]|jgi:thiol-disulfide isomerase/thioredoxin|nr:MAG: redoxin domain-containing protein [Chitinophagaceae bacterium]